MEGRAQGLQTVLQQCVAAQKQLLDSEDYLRVQNLRYQLAIETRGEEVKKKVDDATKELSLDLQRNLSSSKDQIGVKLRTLQSMIEELTTSLFDPDTRTVTAVRLEEMINKIDTITKALNNQTIFRPCEEEPVNVYKLLLGVISTKEEESGSDSRDGLFKELQNIQPKISEGKRTLIPEADLQNNNIEDAIHNLTNVCAPERQGMGNSQMEIPLPLLEEQKEDVSIAEINTENETVMEKVDVKGESDASKFIVGNLCIAKWSSEGGDNCWYRARIESQDGEWNNVVFLDYGNSALVNADSLLDSADRIPAEEHEMVDLGVWEGAVSGKWVVGEPCLVRWTEDNIWYNGVVSAVLPGGCRVQFTDHQGCTEEGEDRVLKPGSEIPLGENMDIGVVKTVENEVVVSTETKSQDQVNTVRGYIVEINESLTSSELTPTMDRRVDEPSNGDIQVEKSKFFAESEEDDLAEKGVDCQKSKVEEDSVEEERGNEGTGNLIGQVLSISKVPTLSDRYPVGLLCFVKWAEDNIWYQAKIESLSSCGQYATVLFYDYGNSDTVLIKEIKTDAQEIPENEIKDVHVKRLERGRSRGGKTFEVGDWCLACWSQDQVIYNAQICQINEDKSTAFVVFVDYGNTEEVLFDGIYQSYEEMLEIFGFEPELDGKVQRTFNEKRFRLAEKVEHETEQNQKVKAFEVVDSIESIEETISFLFLASAHRNKEGRRYLVATHLKTIPVPAGNVKMTLLDNGTLVILSRNYHDEDEDSIHNPSESLLSIWDKSGLDVKEIAQKNIEYSAEIASLNENEFIILSPTQKKIFHFEGTGKLLRTLEFKSLNSCSGLAVDKQGLVVTVNKCVEGDRGTVTEQGLTDLVFLDIQKGKVIKRLEMTDLIGEEETGLTSSSCHSVVCSQDFNFVVNREKVFVLFEEDGEDQADLIESTEFYTFKEITSVIADEHGALLISDISNQKVFLFGPDFELEGELQVPELRIAGPAAMCLDRKDGRLIVHDREEATVVVLSIRPSNIPLN